MKITAYFIYFSYCSSANPFRLGKVIYANEAICVFSKIRARPSTNQIATLKNLCYILGQSFCTYKNKRSGSFARSLQAI